MQRLIVGTKLGQHVQRIDIVGVVVGDALKPRDLADRVDRQAADLAHPLGNIVGHGEDLVGLLVEQEMKSRKCGPLTCQWKFLVFR